MVNELGTIRVASISPSVSLANPKENAGIISNLCEDFSIKHKASIILFPELSLTGYTCSDLFDQDTLQAAPVCGLSQLTETSKRIKSIIIVGAPIQWGNGLYNCAVVISNGKIAGIVPKSYIPNYSEFYEKRWFCSGKDIKTQEITINQQSIPFGTDLLFKTTEGVCFGIEICEDLWVPIAPSRKMCLAGADIIFNLSATNEVIGKHRYLRNLILTQSASCRCGYVYASAGMGESSTDLVFSGNTIIAENGIVLSESNRFERKTLSAIADIDIETLRHDRQHYNSFTEDSQTYKYRNVDVLNKPMQSDSALTSLRYVDPHPFVPSDPDHLHENCTEIISIQSWGLEQRLAATECKKLIVGISGGLDSTLALLVACKAFDRLSIPRKNIIGITMPGDATTSRTKNNAIGLMETLGITHKEIAINPAVMQHFSDIGQDPQKFDAAYENSQARERTQILMDMANKEGGMVLGTGDLSELALGWCTYNGDHMSMYAVNASVPKTLVKHLVGWFAQETDNALEREILLDIIDTPISPKLIPSSEKDKIAQKTEDLVGPYELHDFFLYHMLRYGSRPTKIFRQAQIAFKGGYDDATLLKWLNNFYRRFFSQQFKRSCMPDGPKVGSVCLSPRGDWRMPSDAKATLWLEEIAQITFND